ncbi:MAG: L-threonylcarbamoyladenylate synthase [Bacillota bacterium]|jgi:L-threonylcarbamoyladenylate synthase
MLKTECWKVDPARPDPGVIERAGLILRRGGLVAFPTETVYGLGASALDARAVRAIYEAKGRPADNPLIVHVARAADLDKLVDKVPETARALAREFWPGPLTLVLAGGRGLPGEISAGLGTVAVRVPAHPVALALIAAARAPVAAPSANLSGRPSPTTAGHVLTDLGGRIPLVLDGGPAGMGLESTVLDLSGPHPVVLRPGGVTPARLERVIGPVLVDPGALGLPEEGAGDRESEPPRSPGMKYTHYAPAAPLVLVEGEQAAVAGRIRQLAGEYLERGLRVGILACAETAGVYETGPVLVAGSRRDPAAVASALYRLLREFDGLSVDVILAEGIEPGGLGLAVMNRLRRAAGGRVIRV